MKIDLGWGNSVAVRDAFVGTYHGKSKVFSSEDLRDFDYPNHEGDVELVEITRSVIKRQTNLEYKHVFIVNGATGGCVIAMRAYKQKGFDSCSTRKAPYYVRYPKMVESSGLRHTIQGQLYQDPKTTVAMVDMPSNPLGLIETNIYPGTPVVLDGVYLNRVYMGIIPDLSGYKHEAMIGSYSKLLGINGIRLGWLATNDDLLAERFSELITSEYCGLSTASTDILKYTLRDFNWDIFEATARFKLDCNRADWSRLERFFDGTPVLPVGMFYYSSMDKKAQELFQKAGVSWTKGSAMGTDDGFARFNIGASNENIANAVKAIIKADKL